jgi:hypothetical protein
MIRHTPATMTAVASTMRAVTGSPNSSHPSAIATTGLT